MKSLHLAGLDDLDKLMPLVAGFHAEMRYDTTPEHHEAAIVPLLDGSPHGAIWVIGPRRAPVGYIAVTFGWSIVFGGMDASVDEIYIRPAVRRRGMGHDALDGIAKALREAGVRALHLDVPEGDEKAQKFYSRARFHPREGHLSMMRVL